jgi:hypothetical protein
MCFGCSVTAQGSGAQDIIADNYIQLLKKKVKQSHYMPWRCLGGEEYSSNSFMTSALDGGEWSVSCPSHALSLVPLGQEARWHIQLLSEVNISALSHCHIVTFVL